MMVLERAFGDRCEQGCSIMYCCFPHGFYVCFGLFLQIFYASSRYGLLRSQFTSFCIMGPATAIALLAICGEIPDVSRFQVLRDTLAKYREASPSPNMTVTGRLLCQTWRCLEISRDLRAQVDFASRLACARSSDTDETCCIHPVLPRHCGNKNLKNNCAILQA